MSTKTIPRLPASLLAALAGLLAAPSFGAEASPREVRMEVDCGAPGLPINPWIYGIAYVPRLDERESHQRRLGATARRWGGNPTSRYNWQLGNAFNPGADWYFRNTSYGTPANLWQRFLDDNAQLRLGSALTVPALGWVAKDDSSAGFPVSTLGPQRWVEQGRDAGNGSTQDGRKLPADPTRTSVPWTPSDAEKWIRAIRARDESRGARSVGLYIIDNEPMLWNSTHRDVHPDPVTYDELREKLIGFGGAIRRADPGARIAGPALWGWPALFYSALDMASGPFLRPDRRAHGDVPLLPWVLAELRRHRERTGTRILDAVDVHFYAQSKGVGVGLRGDTDPETSARRIRSTRGLWDPTYVDESWIGEPVMLIPRLRRWIDEVDPGLGIVIGEWSFGAERHPSGGLAVAEALGRFGQLGVEAAFYWTYPADGSYAFHAFRAFRDYDGSGARFGDRALAASAPAPQSLFASSDASGGKLVAIAINADPGRTVRARIALKGCGAVAARRAFAQVADTPGLAAWPGGAAEQGALVETLPPWSIVVLEARLATPPAARGAK